MKTDDLIGKLVGDAAPVERTPAPSKSFAKWVGAAVFSVGVGIAAVGIREDLGERLSDPFFIFTLALLVVLGTASALSAFLLSVPGPLRRGVVGVPVATAFGWVGFLVYSLLSAHDSSGPGAGLGCVQDIVLLGIVPGLVLFQFLNRGAPLRVRTVGFLAMLAAAAFGAIGSQFLCANDSAAHLLLWHVLPVVVLAGLGMGIGSFFLRKRWL